MALPISARSIMSDTVIWLKLFSDSSFVNAENIASLVFLCRLSIVKSPYKFSKMFGKLQGDEIVCCVFIVLLLFY